MIPLEGIRGEVAAGWLLTSPLCPVTTDGGTAISYPFGRSGEFVPRLAVFPVGRLFCITFLLSSGQLF